MSQSQQTAEQQFLRLRSRWRLRHPFPRTHRLPPSRHCLRSYQLRQPHRNRQQHPKQSSRPSRNRLQILAAPPFASVKTVVPKATSPRVLSPNCLQRPRPADLTIGGDQGQAIDQCRSADNAICWILGIRRWKRRSASACAATDWQNNKPRFNLSQKRLEAGVQLDPALAHKRCQFQQADIGDRQTIRALPRIADSERGPRRDSLRVKHQPDHYVRIKQDHFRSPHSFAEIAGATTSPTILPLPARQLKISSVSAFTGTSFATGLPCFVMITVSCLACTSSITARQLALKEPAAIFLTRKLHYDHGHFCFALKTLTPMTSGTTRARHVPTAPAPILPFPHSSFYVFSVLVELHRQSKSQSWHDHITRRPVSVAANVAQPSGYTCSPAPPASQGATIRWPKARISAY